MRIFPILTLAISIPLCTQSPQISPPLNDGEKRQILGQLYELHSCRDEVRAYRDFVSRDTEQDSMEKANADRALDLERQATLWLRANGILSGTGQIHTSSCIDR
jgi:hypothetical protein